VFVNTHELREAFLRFFEERGHRRVPGAPIVPPGDPTLLFTSAGMVQFKPYFMGQTKPPHTRLASVQKCFRTTDIESVGDTKHLTFFEMLGNFSIGDYFKEEMIPWGWEFVTQVLKLPPERLWTSVYLDDDEAYELWRKVGVPEERIRRYGEDENYWYSGDLGPCGPCSEIYYDFGEQFGCGPACEPSHDCGRFLETWNLVFMSFYCDGEKRTGLPSKNIDTGSGLERVATVLIYESESWDKNRLASPYDTDVFAPIIRRIEELSGKRYGEDEKTDRAVRIVAEHARAVTFLVGDERTPVLPSNEERGYVVRRMLRRAVYFGRRQLGIEDAFMAALADAAVDTMAPSYPELERQRGFVKEIIRPEERRFDETLSRGLDLLVDMIDYRIANGAGWKRVVEFASRAPTGAENAAPLLESHGFVFGSTLGQSLAAESAIRVLSESQPNFPNFMDPATMKKLEAWEFSISGVEAFILHDRYGFPIELTREIASEHAFTVDEVGFHSEMERQRERARAAGNQAEALAAQAQYGARQIPETIFRGYEGLANTTEVVDLLAGCDGEGAMPGAATQGGPYEYVERAESSVPVQLFLRDTPFYPEGGGQIGDRGEIIGPRGRMIVEDTQRVAERLIVHRGRVVEGQIAVGDEVTARVDARHRADTMRNHTATHLLHAALRKVLGPHARQAGSLVAPDHLRFDFTHTEAVMREQLTEVERLVNEKVRENLAVHTRQTKFQQAIDEGVLAFFGEKYGEEVRVVEVNTVVPKFSAELCGGTHCERTGEVGLVIITGESSIGSGMRRIEALSGRGAEEFVRERLDEVEEGLMRLGGARGALLPRIEALIAERDALEKRVERMERSLASAPDRIMDGAVDIDGVKVLASQVDLPSTDALRYRVDAVRKTMPSGVAVLGSVIDGRLQFVAIASADAISKGLRADDILKRVAAVAGGSAGGRPEMAQGGGKDASKIGDALAVVPEAVREMLSGAGA
jgi:alanyl-tRNA synthetase